MIPEFPQFKPLELADKEEVEKITGKYPPYSDFNFVSMWSWDIKGEMRISVLNENLVVRFRDYTTGKPFYSFLGNNNVNETADALFGLSKKEELEPKMKLVPEDSVKDLDATKFKVEEDMDNFDYIYDVDVISEYKGGKFSGKRNKTNSFLKNYPDIHIEHLYLTNPVTQNDVLKINEEWLKNKIEKDADFEVNNNELLAIERFFQTDMKDIICVGIFNAKKLIGYAIFEILPNGYSVCDFIKADTKFNYIYDYLMKENAKILKSRGASWINFEQDLGVPGLRKSKMSFMSSYLRKFIVRFAE